VAGRGTTPFGTLSGARIAMICRCFGWIVAARRGDGTSSTSRGSLVRAEYRPSRKPPL
jgi:hypothetical protein